MTMEVLRYHWKTEVSTRSFNFVRLLAVFVSPEVLGIWVTFHVADVNNELKKQITEMILDMKNVVKQTHSITNRGGLPVCSVQNATSGSDPDECRLGLMAAPTGSTASELYDGSPPEI